MRWTRVLMGCFVAAWILPINTEQPGRAVVSVEWLAAHLRDAGLVLLHVGPAPGFAAEHIPGAQFVGRADVAHPASLGDDPGPDALSYELPEPHALEQVLRRLGIDQDSRVVVYWAEGWAPPATRVLFTLQWAGLADRIALLDGGLETWKAAGHPVTADVSTPEPGTINVQPAGNLVVDAEWIQRHAVAEPARYRLIDTRARAFFDGVRDDHGRAGRIPGAGNLPWIEVFDDARLVKDPTALRALFQAAGVRDGQTAIVYCHIGQYATAVVLAARVIGYDVKLYDGSWQDWTRRGLPAETN